MATKHYRCLISILSLIILSPFTTNVVQAQSPPNENKNDNNNSSNPNYFTSAKFSPSMAVIIVVLISAFFFLGFFSIYIRQCGGERMNAFTTSAAAAVGARSRRQRGLDSTILETFPTLVYSEVKEHKVGKGALECAICLNEFEDEDTIRLLPKCDHVFHQECIDAWLATHVTCPVCRANYASNSADAPAPVLPVAVEAGPGLDPLPPTEQVAIVVDDGERKQEMKELARIASRVRRNGSRRGRNMPRSHSTGHSMAARHGGGLDRYTLRLPENIRKDIIASGMLQRERSSSRPTGEESSSRRGRSVRLGRSENWSSLLVRSVSAKIPAFGNWKRGEEGSVKDGSLRGKFAGGGGFTKKNADDDSESSTAVLNRV